MKANTYAIIARAIEEGLEYGWSRAHKHTETPTPEAVREAQHDAIMNSVSEMFYFPQPTEYDL